MAKNELKLNKTTSIPTVAKMLCGSFHLILSETSNLYIYHVSFLSNLVFLIL